MENVSLNMSQNFGIPVGPEAVLRWGERNLPLRPHEKVILGRGPSSDFMIDDNSVSRRHAEIKFANGLYVIRDLGSTNGVFVAGRRVTGETPLMPGNEVQLGFIKMQFHLASALPKNSAPVAPNPVVVSPVAPAQNWLALPPAQPALVAMPVADSPILARPLGPLAMRRKGQVFALRVCTGVNAGLKLALEGKSVFRLGRGVGPNLDLELTDPQTGNFDAYIMKRIDGGFAIRNSVSSGPVMLNGLKLDRDAMPLKPGDLITIGDSVLIFEPQQNAA